jgi:hypothetical protein
LSHVFGPAAMMQIYPQVVNRSTYPNVNAISPCEIAGNTPISFAKATRL